MGKKTGERFSSEKEQKSFFSFSRGRQQYRIDADDVPSEGASFHLIVDIQILNR